MKRRRIDPRRAKLHRNYDVAEIARLYGVHRNSVRAWLKAGLCPIEGGRPALVLGSELRRFLTERRASRKRPTPPGHIFCLGCREPRRPAGNMADCVPRTATTGNLQGICPVCDSILNRRVRYSDLHVVKGDLDVTVTRADGRISRREEPSLNHDSRS